MLTPQDMLNNIRNKAKLDNTDFSKSVAIRLKAGKLKFQLLAANSDNLFKPRTQHMIPTVPYEDDKNEKWLIADCQGENCPICLATNSFKQSGVELEDINAAYTPKYPYKNIRALFTQPEHYLLCAKILSDQADEGSYLPKDAELGSTHLVQFTRTALNNLLSAYEDYMDDFADSAEEGQETPSLFAIFDNEKVAKSLVITARITNQPYSCTFSFNKVAEISSDTIDKSKLELLETSPEVPEEHIQKCVNRIKAIQNYFIKSSDVPISTIKNYNTVSSELEDKTTKVSSPTDKDFDIDSLL